MRRFKPETTTMILKVPAEVKRLFKAWCIMHDTSMTDEIVRFMRATAKTRSKPDRCC